MQLLQITWNVSPEIFSIGPLTIRYYGLFFALGFMVGYLILKRLFQKEKIPVSELDSILMYVFIGAILGARLGHVFFYEPSYYLNHPGEILQIWQGGLASHGGTIGILISLYIFSKASWKKYMWVLDRVAIPTALAGAFIRLGNLMNSEIYGTETNLPWGFIFVRNNEIVAKHPTQIYEAACYVITFIILLLLYNKRINNKSDGLLIGWFFILVFGFRFLIEFIKEAQVSFENTLLINMGQILSVPLIIIGITMVFMTTKNIKLLTK
jgi:phosphatidylglycerol:prolipoprotein diacylglycerol transferase